MALFAGEPIVLAVAESIGQDAIAWPPGTVRFKTAIRVKDVLEQLEAG